MNSGIISKRYAKALLAFGKDRKAEDELYARTEVLARSFADNPELCEALDNPVLPGSRKKELIRVAAGGTVSRELDRFVDLLIRNKRLPLLHSVCLVYGDLYRQEKHIRKALLVTAVPLPPETEEHLQQRLETLTPDTLEFHSRVKPELIGGYMFYYDTYRLDASLASHLRAIREKLTK
ncbi:MAG: F0F1 ATP synthase subunit delta [Parabacteroides sp.]|nr:F0F1 ATP synthase subunit delta [Parabacteroides sp.]